MTGTTLPTIRSRPRRLWLRWGLLVLLCFITLESLVLALALQGRWFILLAPAAACAGKAHDLWRELRRA